MTTPTIRTYADAFGNWHAEVPESVGSRGKCTYAARKAIRSELDEREKYGYVLRVTYVDTNRQGVHHFAEVV